MGRISYRERFTRPYLRIFSLAGIRPTGEDEYPLSLIDPATVLPQEGLSEQGGNVGSVLARHGALNVSGREPANLHGWHGHQEVLRSAAIGEYRDDRFAAAKIKSRLHRCLPRQVDDRGAGVDRHFQLLLPVEIDLDVPESVMLPDGNALEMATDLFFEVLKLWPKLAKKVGRAENGSLFLLGVVILDGAVDGGGVL